MQRYLTALIIALVPPSLRADVAPYFFVGYGRGGDNLAKLTGSQFFNIGAGSGLIMSGGAVLSLTHTKPHNFELQGGIGYIMQTAGREAQNNVDWTRVPLELLYFYRNTQEKLRLGYGITYHIENNLSGNGINSDVSCRLENSLGYVFTVEQYFEKNDSPLHEWIGFGVRYTKIAYKKPAEPLIADGSLFSLTFTIGYF